MTLGNIQQRKSAVPVMGIDLPGSGTDSRPRLSRRSARKRTLQQYFPLCDVLGCLLNVFRPSQIAPVVFIGTKSKDWLTLASQSKIRIDDGKSTFFTHHVQEARRNYMNATER
jgi:hypothetical protein